MSKNDVYHNVVCSKLLEYLGPTQNARKRSFKVSHQIGPIEIFDFLCRSRLMYMRHFTFLFAFLLITLLTSALNAQTITVNGQVLDAVDSSPLIGVNVYEKSNPQKGTTTDLDGKFSLTVNEGSTLVVSYMRVRKSWSERKQRSPLC